MMKLDLPKDFNWKYYLDSYEDLRDAGLKTKEDAIRHYLNHGKYENRFYKPLNKKNNFDDNKEVFEILCEKLTPFLNSNFPTINSKSNKKSLLVETRVLPHLEFVIKNTIQKLGDGWGHIIYCHNNNINQIKSICDQISTEIEIRLLNFELNRNRYNNLLLTSDFWDQINCEKVLIYQTDTFIFKEFDNSFLEWDYIGSPWGPSNHSKRIKEFYNFDVDINSGNGGLSLRNVQSMKDSLKQNRIEKNLDYKSKENECELIYEDIFFSHSITKSNKYKMAPLEVCEKFSYEHYYKEDTFGVHQPFVRSFESDDNFSKFLKKFKGVNIFGFGNLDTGLGHNMRMIVESFKKMKVPYNLTLLNPIDPTNIYLENDKFNFFDTNLFLFNPDYGYNRLLEEFKDKKNIVLWAWELDKVTEKHKKDSEKFDEIWTISDFCFETFKTEIPNKIIRKLNIPGNFGEMKNKDKCKEKFNLTNKFVCLFIFDGNSTIDRKNPNAVIKSFEKSLSNYDDAVLILKSQNLKDIEIKTHFNDLPENVILINELLTKDDLNELINCADVYISLHRSEGSGLTIMEAINCEIPVVCTNYSGNLDFCDENCQLVDYTLVDLITNFNIYKEIKNSKWAEPSIEDASKKLLEVYKNYDLYKHKIKKTKIKMFENFNLDKLSSDITDFLH